MKGLVLAGGTASRLFPLTNAISSLWNAARLAQRLSESGDLAVPVTGSNA